MSKFSINPKRCVSTVGRLSLAIGIGVAVVAVSLFPARTSAQSTQTLHGACQDGFAGGLGSWNWPLFVQKNYGGENLNSGSTYLPNFDKGNYSYIIFRTPAQQNLVTTYSPPGNQGTEATNYPNQGWNQYTMYISPDSTKRLYLTETSSTTQFVNSPGSIVSYTIIDGTHHDTKNIFGGGSISNPISWNTTNVGCVQAAVNVDYPSNWAYTRFTAHQDAGDAIQCDTWDIACHVSGFFKGVGDTFNAVGQAIVRGIGNLFVPDTAVIGTYFDEFLNWMNDKLGFLAYPIVFFSDMFNAFDTESSWCNTTSCTKDFGNLFGQPFELNLGQVQTTMPTMWTWFTAMMRGLLVFALIVGIYKTSRSVQHK